jgi:O-antigen ligase
MFVGATTSKNMLGVACLISGLYFFWDTVTRWPNRKDRQTRRILMVNGAFMVMTLWVLHLSDSATSRACLLLGCSVIFAAYSKLFQRHLKVLIPICLCLYPILAFGLGLNATLIKALGRNPTLTDRTFLWDFLLGMKTNPIFGTGYESFWLGSRLQTVWTKFPGIPEAHNGYLDIYLDLGLVGILLLAVFLIASYRVICQELKSSSELGSLGLGLWTVLIFYNVTEAAFTGFHLMWVIFLVGAVEVPKRLPVLARFAPQERYPKLASGTGNRRFAANKANDRRGPTGVEIKSHINRSRMKTTIKKGDTGRFRTKNENGVDEDLIYHGF